MAENSKIEWTDHTVNLWWGCEGVHRGCDNCYAEYFIDVRLKKGLWGAGKPRQVIKSAFPDLDKFQKKAAAEGVMHRVFVGSMMDIFEKPKPLIDHQGNAVEGTTGELRDKFFNHIDKGAYPNLLFLLLTKRPSNINKMIPANWLTHPPANVMYGASVVDGKSMRDVARHMSKVNGRTFWSVEPLLEFIDLFEAAINHKLPDWIIVGGESGTKRRPFDLEWGRELRDACRILDVPFFFKQVDKVIGIPKDLMVREFPVFF